MHDYQNILDGSFRKHFPEWDKLSDFDPIRLLAEALSGSLAAIEHRQQRVIDSLIDSLPSLLSVEIQQARPAGGQVRLSPSSKLAKAHVFNAGESLRFSAAGEVYLLSFVRDTTLLPGSDTTADVEAVLSQSSAFLGLLKGEAWEAIALPEACVKAPETVLIHYPDGSNVELARESQELLRLRFADPEKFARCFFYNATRHEILLPGGLVLANGFAGGLRVQADLQVLPPHGWLPENATYAGDHPRVLSAVTALGQTRSAVPREGRDAYLGRFYSLVRALSSRNEASLFPQEIALQLPSVDKRVRCAEVAVDEVGKKLSFFVLTGSSQDSMAAAEEAELLESLRKWLAVRVPLSFEFSVKPFYRTPVRCFPSTREPMAGLLKAELERLLQPAPYGTLVCGTELPVAECERQIQAVTGSRMHLQLAVGKQGEFSRVVKRRPGEQFVVDVGLSLAEVGHG